MTDQAQGADPGVTTISRRKAMTGIAGALVVLPVAKAVAAIPTGGDREFFDLLKQHKSLTAQYEGAEARADKIFESISDGPPWGVMADFNLEGFGTLFNVGSTREIEEDEQRWHRLFGGDEEGHRAVDKAIARATAVLEKAEKARKRIERESGYTTAEEEVEKLSDKLWSTKVEIYRAKPATPKALAAQLAFYVEDVDPTYTDGMDRTLIKNVGRTLRRMGGRS